MNKRGLLSLASLAMLSGLMFSGNALAQMAYVEGNDYTLVSPAVKTAQPDKVVVTEIFWYGCPHCFRFEPYVEKWSAKLPEGVVFEQVPSSLNPRWTEHARAYYAFQLMGVLEQVHRDFFDAIHLKRQRLNSVDTIAEFVADHGFDANAFREYYHSFPVDTLVRKSSQKERLYGHEGVPAVIVNGKYLVSGSLAGSNERMIQIIDFLVAKERAR
ncbi:MAG TPA: thiol:disulfide interchange protein DsbA/DsbL [Gammaproteobacteria bacterium]|nr:thiol:disulfide interchange protein DsbA/DsbL [Gammaproteobacteria bacterium]